MMSSPPKTEVAVEPSSSSALEPEPAPEKKPEPEPEPEKKPEPKIDFKCSVCKFISEKCDYFGSRPPFARKLQITEASFVMKDPFSPPPSAGRPNAEYFLVIGAKCTMCEAAVCKSSDCSVFYSRTFCRGCALENIKQFPIEMQSKVRKQFNTTKS